MLNNPPDSPQSPRLVPFWLKSTQVIKKLRGRSLDEARVRAAQALASISERAGLSNSVVVPDDATFLQKFAAPLRSAESLLEAFRGGASSAPVPGLRDLQATAAILREASSSRVIANANAILDNRLSLFGAQEFHFGNPLNWHLEPRAGRIVPRRHWSQIDFLDPMVAGDKKIIWELNRHQYFLTLGRAYAHTADERYPTTFVDHLQAWMASNPPKLGINWASSLEVAYRSIAWLWALMFFRSSPSLTPQVFLLVLKQLTLNGRHIETYLSTYFSPNTHITGEALGLYYLGAFLPFLPEATNWRARGRAILLQQLPKQVRNDGTYFENATYYHRYALDIYVQFSVLAGERGEPLEPTSLARIEALADALAALAKPDGTHGLFGDDDGGRLLPLDEAAPNNFRPALCNAAVLFERADFKAVAGDVTEETIWLFGPAGAARCRELDGVLPPSRSRALPDGGFFVMRDGGGCQANQLVIDCGPHGALNCGHAHADALAFELVAHGRSILMDSGTFTYSGSLKARRHFRSTAYHNAFTVDRASSSEPAGPFSWATVARCKLTDWFTSDWIDTFEGEHDGFRRLTEPASHKRSLLFIKNSYWILRDRAVSTGAHDYAQHFHFSPEAKPFLVSGAIRAGDAVCREQTPGAAGLDIITFAEGGSWAIEDGWVSTRYTDRRTAKVAVFTKPKATLADIVTFLIPRAPNEVGNLPDEVAAEGGRAFALRDAGKGGSDLFLVRDDATVAVSGVETDAAWLWLRKRDDRLDELIMRGGSWIVLDGKTLFHSTDPARLMLRRQGEDLVLDVETAANFELATLGCSSVLHAGQRIATTGRPVLHFVDGLLDSTSFHQAV